MLLDGRYRFDNFVVGAANRLAVAAARAVAESPGPVYNPLFVYGGSGLGKTHLVAAIAHHARALDPSLGAEYTSLEDFVDQLHLAVADGRAEDFKRRWQQLDLLLLDDVQFLTGRRETQSELLRLFNALHARGGQIVLASDRPPSEIADVDERLVTRLAGGLIVDVGAPDFETRVAILRRKSAERSHAFAPGVLERLASMPFANVRELQGALNRLLAQATLGGRAVEPDDVARIAGPVRTRTTTLDVAPAEESPARTGDEFASFLVDVASVLAEHVEGWRGKLGERIAFWAAEGMRTEMLERALALEEAPDVDALDRAFAAARERLRALESEVAALDPALATHDAFRDPERLAEAEHLLDLAILRHDPPPMAGAAPRLDALAAEAPLAVRAAREVLEEPGMRYNPLVLCGPEGAGKSALATSLAHALGEQLREREGTDAVVACLGGEAFVEGLIAALESGRLERWRARFRAASALVLDDVDALVERERSQDELFHLFNHLHARGRQLVLTTTRPPAELEGLAARLRSRLEGGLVIALEPRATPAVDAGLALVDREKVVAEWLALEGRLIEELR